MILKIQNYQYVSRNALKVLFLIRSLGNVHLHNIYFMLFSESSSKYIESKQSQTTLPFGWDDASCMKTLKSMVVNSYNAVSVAVL